MDRITQKWSKWEYDRKEGANVVATLQLSSQLRNCSSSMMCIWILSWTFQYVFCLITDSSDKKFKVCLRRSNNIPNPPDSELLLYLHLSHYLSLMDLGWQHIDQDALTHTEMSAWICVITENSMKITTISFLHTQSYMTPLWPDRNTPPPQENVNGDEDQIMCFVAVKDP